MWRSLAAYELAVMTMFRNEAPHFKEWVEYHRMLGVDYFLMYDDESTDNWREVLNPYIREGLVEVIDWSKQHVNQVPRIAQIKAFRDGLRRLEGKAKWLMPIDLDEFVLPMKETSILDCLNKHFPDAKAVYINWRNFGTGGVSVPNGHPFLFSLNSCSLPAHPHNAIGKSIVQPDCVRIQDVWYPHHFPLKEGFVYLDGDGNAMRSRGVDWLTDGRHHGRYMRINHYKLGDESRFHNYRLPKVQGVEKESLLEQYRAFSLIKDSTIHTLIKKFPDVYERVWKPYVTP